MKRSFLFSLLVYIFGAAIIFPYIRDYADNPDTFQYLEIAKKYMSGDWQHALNLYWSPLISWLLIPFLFLIKNEILAFKTLQFLIGMFTLVQWCSLIEKIPLNNQWKKFLEFFSIPFILSYGLLNATPDLLFLALSLRLLNLTMYGRVFMERKATINMAIVGALLYLTKAFGLPLFICWMIFFFIIQRKLWKSITTINKNAILLFAWFIIICSSWIFAISYKTNMFTISEAGNFNMSRDVAPIPTRGGELPILSKGLLKPAENAICAWETPGEFVSKQTVNIVDSPSEYFSIVKRNLLSIYYYDFRNQAGIIFLILFLIFLIRRGIKELMQERWIIFCLIFLVLTYLGYSLVVVHMRYVWLNTWLMVLMTAYFIERSFGIEKWRILSKILFLGLLIVAMKRPLKEIFFTKDVNNPAHWMVKAARAPFTTLWVTYKEDANLQRDIAAIRSDKIINGNVASIKAEAFDRDPYTAALRISSENGCKYFGQLDTTSTILQLLDELKKNEIDYLIMWKNSDWGDAIPVYSNPETGMRIYNCKK